MPAAPRLLIEFFRAWFFCLAWAALSVSALAAAGKDVPSIDVIRAGYAESLSSIRSIDCQFKLEMTRRSGMESTGQLSEHLSFYDVDYLTDGNRVATTVRLGNSADQIISRFRDAYDGRFHSTWSERVLATEKFHYFAPMGILSKERVSVQRLPFSLNAALGKTFWGERSSLPEVIAAAHSPEVTAVALDGSDCFLVEIKDHSGPLTIPGRPVRYRTQIWFDPSLGFLPRKIYSYYSHDGQSQSIECHVKSFTTANNPLTGQSVYLPAMASYERPLADYSLTLIKAEINKTILLSRFAPEFPQGTKVTDRTQSGGAKFWVVGPPALRKRLEEQADAAERSRSAGTNKESMPAALLKQAGDTRTRASSGHRSTLALGCALLVCVSAFLFVFWMKLKKAGNVTAVRACRGSLDVILWGS